MGSGLTHKLAFITRRSHLSSGRMGSNQSNLVLAQTLFRQWAPNELIKSCRASNSECLFSEEQTQERRRFYNGSVKQRRALRFTREGRRHVTVIQTFIRKSDLTAGQVKLDPSMEVRDHSYCSSVAPEYGVSEASTPSTMNLCSPIIQVTFFTILVGSSRVAQKNSRF